ncbi:MAG: EamA family transporter [Candidatus Andersenbacteria bacterium]
MTWIVLALIAHVVNALVFIIDKGILNSDSPISQPLRLTLYTGLLSGAAVLLLPFQYAPPTSFVLLWSTVSGACFLAALWWFFSALKAGEPSRVVPIIGSAVPVFTLLFAWVALGERLQGLELVAVLFLIIGGALLSIRVSGTKGLSIRIIIYILLGGAAFAAHFSASKYLYSGFEPFLAAFVYSRIAVAVLSVLVLLPLLRAVSPNTSKKSRRKKKKIQWSLGGAFLASKVLGTGAFLLQNYAINMGSVTVVNALQGTQYAFVLVLAAVISLKYPRILKEELRRVALIQKITGILIVSTGLILLLL